MERAIVHMDLDSFFVSCERLGDSRLNNRPVIIGGKGLRGVVASCSYQARSFGVHAAMPIKMARQLCPDAVFLQGNMEVYSKFSKMVTEIIKQEAPLYEKASIDEFYIDATGMDRFFGCYQWAKSLRQRIIKETGLPISFALSVNKTVSKVATGEAKPNHHKCIVKGEEKSFLAPLSLQKIPMVGSQTYKVLQKVGLRKIGEVQKTPEEMMYALLGKTGLRIWQKCHGIDPSPVIPYSERKSISIERTFGQEVTEVKKIGDILSAMGERVAYILRGQNKSTCCVCLKLRYSDFNTFSRQVQVAYTSCDYEIIEASKRLFLQLYIPYMPIRLVGIRLSGLIAEAHQINLFENSDKKIALYQAMDKMRNRYGQGAVSRLASRGNLF